MPIKTKDSKKTLEFDITTYTKGFVAEVIIDGNTVKEYFQFKEIHKVIHHPNIGVEIVGYNNGRRVFYNDLSGEAQTLYDAINTNMLSWMDSNLN